MKEKEEDLMSKSKILIDKLLLVKQNYNIKTCTLKIKEQELKVSVRRDVVSVQLKQILENSSDYESLKNNIQTYIDKLLNIQEDLNNEEIGQGNISR